MAATTTPAHSEYSRDALQAKVTLGRNACGVLLELEVRQTNGPRVVVITAFTQTAFFEEWCKDDPLRFAAPVIHQKIRRGADALWRNDS
jgi:hypothetical protein